MRKRYAIRKRRLPSITNYSPRYELRRIKWRFHPYDVDPFPSIPHGHSLDGKGLKLHVKTGDIYDGKSIWGKLKEKDHDRLLKDPQFIQLALRAEKFHEDLKNNKRIMGRRLFRNRYLKPLIFEAQFEKYD